MQRAVLSPQAGAVKPLQWLHIRLSTFFLKSDTEISVVAHVGYLFESLETFGLDGRIYTFKSY
jgi:hypothetical protein